MITFQRALELSTSRTKRLSWRWPRNGRLGSLIVRLHSCETGWSSEGISAENRFRVDVGAVGARSGAPVDGLSQVPLKLALAARNERSSRKKISRFLPQRNFRYRPLSRL